MRGIERANRSPPVCSLAPGGAFSSFAGPAQRIPQNFASFSRFSFCKHRNVPCRVRFVPVEDFNLRALVAGAAAVELPAGWIR